MEGRACSRLLDEVKKTCNLRSLKLTKSVERCSTSGRRGFQFFLPNSDLITEWFSRKKTSLHPAKKVVERMGGGGVWYIIYLCCRIHISFGD